MQPVHLIIFCSINVGRCSILALKLALYYKLSQACTIDIVGNNNSTQNIVLPCAVA